MKKLVSFFEIPTADFGRAVKFYETVLNLELSVMEYNPNVFPSLSENIAK